MHVWTRPGNRGFYNRSNSLQTEEHQNVNGLMKDRMCFMGYKCLLKHVRLHFLDHRNKCVSERENFKEIRVANFLFHKISNARKYIQDVTAKNMFTHNELFGRLCLLHCHE